MVDELAKVLPRENIILATTTNPLDSPLVDLANALGIPSYRGDENDVLRRFIDTIEHFNLTSVLRICTDNPFLRSEYIKVLCDRFSKEEKEYMTFEFPDGTPIMKSHIGLFAEIMSASFLRRLDRITSQRLYREHVTNYVYEHRGDFETTFIPVPEAVANRRDIRLTIDTPGDFEVAQALYQELMKNKGYFSVEDLVKMIDSHPEFIQRMEREIERNSK
ncbi:MAG: glycosyl transferase family 2 [Flavobacteriales bacterium]|nr:glycosyl transferase family 2 [Flavobacteriales bacterium]